MFCQKCGNELPEGATFCASCGAKQEVTKENKEKSAKEKKEVNFTKIPPKFIWIFGGILVFLILIIELVVHTSKGVNLNKYVTVTFEGYDTVGRANIEFDTEAFEKKYGKKIKVNTENDLVDGLFEGIVDPCDVFEEAVLLSSSLDKNSNLKNGDEVILTFNFKKEDMKKVFGLNVKATEKTFKVENLQDIAQFDAFEGVEVEFSGIAPNGRAQVINAPEDDGLFYSVNDEGYGLSNGDTVTVKVNYTYGSEEKYATETGKIPSAKTKEFTVEGLDEYVSTYEDIGTDTINQMKTDVEDLVTAHLSKSYPDTMEISDLNYAGYIFHSTKKGETSNWLNNGVIFIYKGTISKDEVSEEVYFPVVYKNILKTKENITYEGGNSISGSEMIKSLSTFVNGYTNPYYLHADCLKDCIEIHDISCGDGFEIYSDYTVVSSLNDVVEDELKIINEDAMDEIKSYVENDQYLDSKISDLKVKGYYFLKAKEKQYLANQENMLAVVCEATVSSNKGKFDDTTVYFPVLYHGVLNTKDGFNYLTKEGCKGRSLLGSSFNYIEGYTDGKIMYKELVSTMRANYTYEVSDGLKEFGD